MERQGRKLGAPSGDEEALTQAGVVEMERGGQEMFRKTGSE